MLRRNNDEQSLNLGKSEHLVATDATGYRPILL